MAPAIPRRRRPRPVADAPIDALLGRCDDLAKGWLLALIEQAPLTRAGAILAQDIARDGPRLCDAVLRAIADETDLHRLEPDGALTALAARAGSMAGAGTPVEVSSAVDALHGVVWAALRDELRGPEPEIVYGLAERLSLVVERVRSAALGDPCSGGPGVLRPLAAVPEQDAERGGSPRPAQDAERGGSPRPAQDAERGGSPRPAQDAERTGPSGALWMDALQDEIDRAVATGAPLSLLLAEVVGEPAGERESDIVDAQDVIDPDDLYGRFGRALRAAVRRQEILACESDSRAWIIAPGTSRSGADALGSRIGDALTHAETWGGAPLTAAVGVAVLREDGRTSAELMRAAQEARSAAFDSEDG